MGAGLFMPLAAALASAPAADEGAGWVRPAADELQRVFGVRFIERIGERPFLARKGEEWTTPFISKDHTRVYAATNAGVLEARALATGERIWVKERMNAIGASMAEHDGRLLLSSGSSFLSLDDTSGTEKWRLDLGGAVAGRIVLTGTTALLPVRPNHLVAVDVAKGTVLWRLKRPTPEGITMRGQAAASVDAPRRRAFVGFSDGAVVAVALDSGETLWSQTLGQARGAFADVDAQPLLLDDRRSILVASISGGLFRLEADSGRVIWKKELNGISSMVRVGELVVAGSVQGQVLGVAPESGRVRWRFRFKKGAPVEALPLGHGQGLVYVGNADGPSVVLDGSNGKPIDRLFLGSGTAMGAAWRDPDLAVLSNHGLLLVARFGSGAGIHRSTSR